MVQAADPIQARKAPLQASDLASNSYQTPRDRHLFGPGPKRILSLDGGGLRTVVSLAFLERIEQVLAEQYGREVKLGEFFDLIGGTSTGALVATGLALGFTTSQLKEYYLQQAARVFKRSYWRLPLLQTKFDTRVLKEVIDELVGVNTLDSPELITGLCLVTKRLDTGVPWIITNNPRQAYWEDLPADTRGPGYLGNRHYRLANLVRASTAAPHYFDPTILAIDAQSRSGTPPGAAPFSRLWRSLISLFPRSFASRARQEDGSYGLFVDGGLTPYNNPSLALWMQTQLLAYGLNWPSGPDRLSIVSLGSGSFRPRLSLGELGFASSFKLSLYGLVSVLHDMDTQTLQLMQWFGQTPQPWWINSEIGALVGDVPAVGKMFRFLRYDLMLEKAWLAAELNLSFTDAEVARLRFQDDPTVIPQIYEIGMLAAKRQIKPEHWSGVLDRGLKAER